MDKNSILNLKQIIYILRVKYNKFFDYAKHFLKFFNKMYYYESN